MLKYYFSVSIVIFILISSRNLVMLFPFNVQRLCFSLSIFICKISWIKGALWIQTQNSNIYIINEVIIQTQKYPSFP